MSDPVDLPFSSTLPPDGVLRPGVALCVDLDGTLVKSDTLHDSLLALLRQNPAECFKIPGWIAKGKASFKRHVTGAVELDVAHLPYNRPLLEYLRIEHGRGRAIYLATAADKTLAERVAAYCGIFAGTLASDGSINLAGGNKLAAFQQHFGEGGFCYIGNATPDIVLLTNCEAPMVANPWSALTSGLKAKNCVPAAVFEDRTPTLKAWLRAVRLHQWAKNALIFVPLLLAHNITTATVVGSILAFFSFGFCASSTYIVNDMLDLEVDRKHPRKRRRPFAAGDLSAFSGAVAIALLFIASVVIAVALPHIVGHLAGPTALFWPRRFLFWLLFYTVTTLSYSLYFKRKLLLDVFILSGLYTVRILAGHAATGIVLSPWLAGFSVFFFLSLAFVKRFSELEGLRTRGGEITNGRGYLVSDLEQVRVLGVGSMFAAVVVMTLYVNNPDTTLLYHHATRLWGVVIVLLFWLAQVWMLASRGELHDDPVVFAITDKRSLLLGVLMAAVVYWAL